MSSNDIFMVAMVVVAIVMVICDTIRDIAVYRSNRKDEQ